MIQQAVRALKVLLLEASRTEAEAIVQALHDALPCDVLVVDARESFLQALDEFVPDVVVSNHSAGALRAPAALALLQARRPGCPLILVTDAIEGTEARCLKSGAADLVRRSDLSRLPGAIRLAVRQRAPLRALTDRQFQVLHRLASGESTRTIARKLKLSVKTIETHRAHVMERLNFPDLSALVRYAVRTGVISANR